MVVVSIVVVISTFSALPPPTRKRTATLDVSIAVSRSIHAQDGYGPMRTWIVSPGETRGPGRRSRVVRRGAAQPSRCRARLRGPLQHASLSGVDGASGIHHAP